MQLLYNNICFKTYRASLKHKSIKDLPVFLKHTSSLVVTSGCTLPDIFKNKTKQKNLLILTETKSCKTHLKHKLIKITKQK